MNRTTKIILGVVGVLLLCCIGAGVAVTVGGTFLGRTVEQAIVESPEEAAQAGQSILNYTLPAGYEEQGAFNLLGNTIVMIGPADQQTGMVIMLASFSSGLVSNEAEMRQQLEDSFAQQGQSAGAEFAEVSTQDITINGAPTVLRTAEGTDENGNQLRQATAAFSTDDSLGMLMIMGDANDWDAAAVEAFLDSIR